MQDHCWVRALTLYNSGRNYNTYTQLVFSAKYGQLDSKVARRCNMGGRWVCLMAGNQTPRWNHEYNYNSPGRQKGLHLSDHRECTNCLQHISYRDAFELHPPRRVCLFTVSLASPQLSMLWGAVYLTQKNLFTFQ